MKETYDFSGWATRNDLRCSDGRIIKHNAFRDNDGKTVPLVWNHRLNEPENVLGHALLENRDEGVYCYGTFNDTENGQLAKILIKHGDINGLSIYANKLKQIVSDVVHGNICEVSLVHAGANPGAYIDTIIEHSEEGECEMIIYADAGEPNLIHSDTSENKDTDDETIQDVFNTLTDKQKKAVYAIIGQAISGEEDNDEEESEDTNMKHNIFDNDDYDEDVLSHSEMTAIITDAKRYGSLRESVLQHGIEHIDYLFPEAKTVTPTPDFISRPTGWVQQVMNGVHHTPFSRIKSVFADITEDDARAKGYIKGKQKKDEVFSLLKRTTSPTTVYKKQKMERDDVVDITDFDVVSWIKSEMRLMLDEELARAILVGDNRSSSSDDKINEMNIRPIWKDDDLYTIKQPITTEPDATSEDKAREFIKSAIKARKNYKGTGSPKLYMTEDMLTECLLLTDTTGRDLYDSVEKLATKLRVSEIITVPVMENLERTDGKTSKKYELCGIIVNLADYNVGSDKGGAVNMFDDFDIDYNAQKYLIETRCSGALIKPYSAIALEFEKASD